MTQRLVGAILCLLYIIGAGAVAEPPSTNYQVPPAATAPASSYAAPAPAPDSSYGAPPAPQYGPPPAPTYGPPPAPTYGPPPAPTYGPPPAPTYGAPKNSYVAPTFSSGPYK